MYSQRRSRSPITLLDDYIDAPRDEVIASLYPQQDLQVLGFLDKRGAFHPVQKLFGIVKNYFEAVVLHDPSIWSSTLAIRPPMDPIDGEALNRLIWDLSTSEYIPLTPLSIKTRVPPVLAWKGEADSPSISSTPGTTLHSFCPKQNSSPLSVHEKELTSICCASNESTKSSYNSHQSLYLLSSLRGSHLYHSTDL